MFGALPVPYNLLNYSLHCLLATATPVTLNLGINMNIELDEVVVLDVTDDALELAAGGAQGGTHGLLASVWGYSC